MQPHQPTLSHPPELWRLSATEAVAQLKAGRVTPLQLVEAAEARWAATDRLINAMPITCWERARQCAKQLMREGFPAHPPRGYLYGEGSRHWQTVLAPGADSPRQLTALAPGADSPRQLVSCATGLPIAVKDVTAVKGLPLTQVGGGCVVY
jgi:Asp-tRNA(Asn)/Glu-tRNA(Gln) amidotransferase A subunit family amidase